MTTHSEDVPVFEDANQEREWLAQERAVPGYRLIVQVLQEPQRDGLPPGFATHVAARANARLASSARFEFALLIGLAMVTVLAASVVIVTYGHGWRSSAGGGRLLVFAACLATSWLADRWLPRNQR